MHCEKHVYRSFIVVKRLIKVEEFLRGPDSDVSRISTTDVKSHFADIGDRTISLELIDYIGYTCSRESILQHKI